MAQLFGMYFSNLSGGTDVCVHESPALRSTKTEDGTYQFKVENSSVQDVKIAQEDELMRKINTNFMMKGDETCPEPISVATMYTIGTVDKFKEWLYVHNLSLSGTTANFMINLIIGVQESGKTSFEAARYFYSFDVRRRNAHRTVLYIPKQHKKFGKVTGFEVTKTTMEEAKAADLFGAGHGLSNSALHDNGGCQLLLGVKDDRLTHFAQWHHFDEQGMGNYVLCGTNYDVKKELPVLVKVEEPNSKDVSTYIYDVKRYCQATAVDISEPAREVTKKYHTMPYVHRHLQDGSREGGLKGFELTLHALNDLVDGDVTMKHLTQKLHWVFVVFSHTDESKQLWTENGDGLIQELAAKWTKLQRDRLQWYVNVHCADHDVLAIEMHKKDYTDLFPDDITTAPWERFFVIKAAAYEPHVDRCTTAVHDAQPGDMAKLYHKKTTKGIFKYT
jgi:hypothetical protein